MAKKKIITTTTVTEVVDETKPLLIAMLLDMSGSMYNVWDATVEGVNEYVDGQRTNPDTEISLNVFDDIVEKVYGPTNVSSIPKLTKEVYKPRGWTALRDAIGKTIREVEKVESQYDKILVYITTDGGENRSTEIGPDILKKMIADKEKAGWTFVYFGANQDAWATSQNLGFTGSNRYTYTSDVNTTKGIYASMSASTASYGRGGNADTVFASGLMRSAVSNNVSSPSFSNINLNEIDEDGNPIV